MASKNEGGSKPPEQQQGIPGKVENLNHAVIIDGDELRESVLSDLLTKANNLNDVIQACKDMEKFQMSKKMKDEVEKAIEGIKALGEIWKGGTRPSIPLINTIDLAPVRRKLRAIIHPADASASIIAQSPQHDNRQPVTSGLYDDLPDTKPGQNSPNATVISVAPQHRPNEKVEGTVVVSPLPKPVVSSHDAVTGKYPTVKPKKPWWKIW